MNILILNWRDPRNPLSGGAEKLNLQIARALIKQGNSIVWYSTKVKGLPSKETFDGITIIRYGNILTHYLSWPFFFYTHKFEKVDMIIDCIHGIGYLSNIVTPHIKKRILICEIAKNIWDEMVPFPANHIGKVLEYLELIIYSFNKFWTISDSTARDLENLRINNKSIKILPMGFDAPKNVVNSKTKKLNNPTALFVGRLAHMKGIKDAIEAIHLVNKKGQKKWRLVIIGRGTDAYEKELRDMVARLHMTNDVIFLGYVSEKEKFEQMAEAWVLLVPSSREGWGMIVPEANYAGTQVIAYNSPGLRDSVKMYAKENILVEKNPQAVQKALQKIQKPKLINEKFITGWDRLHEVVIKDVTSF